MPESTGPQVRDILRPREHGAWSLLLEPIALGLLVAPSSAGAALAGAATALFLARRPAQLAFGATKDPRRRATARICLIALLGLVGACLAAAAQLAGLQALWPLLLAVPPAILFVRLDSRGEARTAAAELAGAAAFAAIPAACATLAGIGWPTALALAALALLRTGPAILVVRTYLRRHKGQPMSVDSALAASWLAMTGAAILVFANLVGGNAIIAALLLLLRAVWLLGPLAPDLRATQLGALESVLGLGFVLAVGLG